VTDSEVIELVNRSLINEFELDPGVMTPDAHLVEGLGFDSLDLLMSLSCSRPSVTPRRASRP
jgi:acyl carrier protein